MNPTGAALRPMAVSGRIERAREALETAGVEALVITSLDNVRYLTGFTGSAATLVVTASRAVLLTDGRYQEQAAAELAGAGVCDRFDLRIGLSHEEQRRMLTDAVRGSARIGLEGDHVAWSVATSYMGWFEPADVVSTSGLVEALRAVKDDGEIDRIEAACRIADAALAAVQGRLAEGPTEVQFARELESAMFARGAEDISFTTIVGSGPNGALPHHRAGERRVVEGDLVVVDFGAMVDGYHSDMTRTFSVGDPTPEQSRLLAAATAAQAAGAAAVAPGVATADVDAACRAVLDEAGLGELFNHGTGHGVGLQIHEHPMLGRTSTATLAAGNVVTVEPGVYVAGLGGVRVEDSLVVTTAGARPLTSFPKDHRCLPSAPTTSRPG